MTGTFHDLDKELVSPSPIRQNAPSLLPPPSLTPHANKRLDLPTHPQTASSVRWQNELTNIVYGATEDERERMMKWAQENRMALFQE